MKVGAGTTTAIFFLDIVCSSFFFLLGSTVRQNFVSTDILTVVNTDADAVFVLFFLSSVYS